MILKSIVLEGIRSYKDETPLPISMGTTLFEGDIASGKSTILYAIEFALFGLGALKASFLLRNGARRGGVTLVFEADGKEYEVHRSLERKGRGIQQADCYIKGPEGKASLAAGELKERILQVLKFHEPSNPRAQSVIYRYAIFTPQEEMKEVILKDLDERLQTLRKAFNIEQYKIAVQNSSVVASTIKGRTDYLNGATDDIDETRTKLEQEKSKAKELAELLKPLKKREGELKTERKTKRDSLKEFEKARENMKMAEERVPLIKRELDGKNDLLEKLIVENTKIRKKIMDEYEPRISEIEGVKKPTDKTKDDLRREVREYRAGKEEAEGLRAKLDQRIENFDSILENNICPVCEREVEPRDFASRSLHLKEERELKEKEIQRLTKKIEELDNLVEEVGGYEDAQKELKILASQLKGHNEKIEENDHGIRELEPVVKNLQSQLQAAEDEVKPLANLLNQIERVEGEIEDIEAELHEVGQKIAGIDERIRGAQENQTHLEEEIRTKERQLKIRDSLTEHKIWLIDYLAPTIDNIEKHVMISLNQRFNLQFQKWFQILMEDPDMQVRIDEDFSPVIEREGYEQEFPALSGGEKTSVALAYRLALNIMVQEVAAGGGTDLLILDEPTDGFSKEQLSKVRDVLTELKCPQVILVSHERELEAFADHVYRVERVNGISRVSPQNGR